MSVSVTQTVKDIDNNKKKQAFKSKKMKKGFKEPSDQRNVYFAKREKLIKVLHTLW